MMKSLSDTASRLLSLIDPVLSRRAKYRRSSLRPLPARAPEPSTRTLTRFSDSVSETPVPLYLTLFTAMFVHGGLLHILGNMLYLWIFGNNIEDALGHLRFFFFYFLCGLAATLAHVLSAPSSKVPIVGASGAIAGVLGAYFITYPRARVSVLFLIWVVKVPAMLVLGLWFLIQIRNSMTSMPEAGGVAWFAHIGGFIAGMLLMARYRQKHRPQRVFS